MSVHIQDLSVCRAVHNQFVVSLHLRKTMNHNEKCLFLQLELHWIWNPAWRAVQSIRVRECKKKEILFIKTIQENL